ncbi:DNA-processing protein DprA [Ahrensia sp. 13_GOM-1096m]|uniref:DNA-processing protein DprA n=1 Tax=Ahrensia sp. 13_GOM-1096m TaxID=1380380 RepID=UPI0009DE2CE5|nr:DNA-processing protein DprA [Ahrensia sp. 13_GOM-1096m]
MNQPTHSDITPAQFELSDRQRLSWLRLYRSENVGPATFRDLINHCGSASAALEMLPEMASRSGGKRSIRIASLDDVERELEATTKFGARIIGLGEPDYPYLLRYTELAPPLITVMGNSSALNRPSISIVGSRNASMVGIKMAQQLAGALSEAGHVIVSGLARGIDRAAHEASLEYGTVAAMAGGIDQPYPPENIALLKDIIASGVGCAITDKPFGWEPRARDFPRRNRVIAALSMGLIVIEAAQRSGSLISARLANELGRTVFAVPGSPLDPRSQGTNKLIREGATLITSADDVLESLKPVSEARQHAVQNQLGLFEKEEFMTLPPSDDARTTIMSLLSPSPTGIDDIIAHSGFAPAQVALIILELDLAGQIERHSANRVSLLGTGDR